jgi:phage recombination protein Bet
MPDNEIIAFQGNQIKVTKDEYDTFISAIVAQNATPAEIRLYLFDCDRRGVHPLDKLIHFTKRSGRYAPVISIDYMRIRAESSGVYLGSDDAVFDEGDGKYPVSAKVTVWKSVEGRNGRFEATARWSEYAPDLSSNSAFMWKKMPHTMLAKCAEALALRKAFPGQLAGLYASEEMAQDGRYVELAAQTAGELKAAYEPAGSDVGDGENMPETTPLVQAAEELADGYTGAQFLSSAAKVKKIVALTGKTTQEVCKFLGALEKRTKFTIGTIVQMMTATAE